MYPSLVFANIRFSILTRNQLFDESRSRFLHIVTVNSDILVEANKNPEFLALINDSDVTVDGQIPLWIIKSKFPDFMIEKISGSDLIYDVIEQCRALNKSLYLLGGNQIANAAAIEKIRSKYEIKVDGYSPPYMSFPFDLAINHNILERIAICRPDYLFVGFGAPKQELWIRENKKYLEYLGVNIVVGCGGTFDMIGGLKPRAPRFIQKLGLESMYRLLIEPKFFRVRRLINSFGIIKYIR